MQLAANVFDVWTFRHRGAEVEFLLLYTSVEKATRHNRRFATMQAIGVDAAEVADSPVLLRPSEHSDSAWLS